MKLVNDFHLLGEGNLIICCTGSRENYVGSRRSVGKIVIIILSFRVATSKSKNTAHRGKETCAIMSTQVYS